ncbi:MAG: hypothetical protein MJ025_06535 [Victivallaceae bacterium]|nr:hypothetical protein [Victivallaceae bacterium]
MLKLMIAAIPAIASFAFHGFFLIFAAKITALGGNGWQVNLPAIAGGISYPIATYAFGRAITPRRVTSLLAAGGAVIILTSIGIRLWDSLAALVSWSICLNVATALYTVPIQLLLKRVQGDSDGRDQDDPRSLGRSVGKFLVGVSLGQGLGMLLCGYIPHHMFCNVGCLVGAFMIAVMYAASRRYGPIDSCSKLKNDDCPDKPMAIPRTVIAGWAIVGLLSFGLSFMSSGVSFHGAAVGLDEPTRASALSMRSWCEVVVVLLAVFSQRWLSNRLVPAGIAFVIMASHLFFFFGGNADWFHIASGMFGVGLGIGLFYTSYHALAASGANGKYAVVSEIVIGVTQFLGPVCGATATHAASGRPFAIEALASAAVAAFAIWLFRGGAGRTPRPIM